VDSKGKGGFVVLPPSRHYSGRSYSWHDNLPIQDLKLDFYNEVMGQGSTMQEAPAKMQAPEASPDPEVVVRAPKAPANMELEQVKSALTFIDADSQDKWISIGIIMGRYYRQTQEAYDVYAEWAAGFKQNAADIKRQKGVFFVESRKRGAGQQLSMGSLIRWAIEGGWSYRDTMLDHFIYIKSTNTFVFAPNGFKYAVAGLDASKKRSVHDGKLVKPSEWVKANNAADYYVDHPALPHGFVDDVMPDQGGDYIGMDGVKTYNRFKMPVIEQGKGDPSKCTPLLDHLEKMIPDEQSREALLDVFAMKIQKPARKVRWAVLLAGGQGVGKDTIIKMLSWPLYGMDREGRPKGPSATKMTELLGDFNEYVKEMVVNITELETNLHRKSDLMNATKNLIDGNPSGS